MIKILNRYTDKVIIEGEYETIKELIEANFTADLRGADLRGSNLWAVDLRAADLGGADLRAAKLGGADLRGANIWGAKILASQKDGLLSALGVVLEEDNDE